MEKEYRKNNVIIKGTNTKNEGQLQCSEVEAFIEGSLKIKVKIIAIREIKQTTGLRMIMAKCENFEQKLQIMRAKGMLRGKKCCIDNDLTIEERKIESRLRSRVREGKERGENVKVEYRKMFINGEVWD